MKKLLLVSAFAAFPVLAQEADLYTGGVNPPHIPSTSIISDPLEGEIFYDETNHTWQGYANAAWHDFLAASSPATATTYGTVKGGYVPGSTSGSATGSGYIGEVIKTEIFSANDTSLTNGSWVYGANDYITLPAGVWQIYGLVNIYGLSGATVEGVIVNIGTATGDNSTGMVDAYAGRAFIASTAWNQNYTRHTVQTLPRVVQISSSTTYYIKTYTTGGSGTRYRNGATLIAVRIG